MNDLFTYKQKEELVELLLELSDQTKIYFGCDSVAYRKRNDKSGKPEWWAKFATVAVVHKNGKNGCKVFRNITHMRVFDDKKARPSDRLMKEVQLVSQLYVELIDLIEGYDTEIHLDINPDKKWGSSVVATQAAGYVLGVTQIDPANLKLKPDAWGSSFAADGIGRGYHERAHVIH